MGAQGSKPIGKTPISGVPGPSATASQSHVEGMGAYMSPRYGMEAYMSPRMGLTGGADPKAFEADITTKPLRAMQNFIPLDAAEKSMLEQPLCMDSAEDATTEGPLATYMKNTLERLKAQRVAMAQETAQFHTVTQAVYEQAQALHGAVLVASKSDTMRKSLVDALQSANALAHVSKHVRNCKTHTHNASSFLQILGDALEGGAVYLGKEAVHKAGHHAVCADSLGDHPALQGFVRAVAAHLQRLVVARLALMEAASELGSARQEALLSLQRLSAALGTSSHALKSLDWVRMEELMQTLHTCTSSISSLHRAVKTAQERTLPPEAAVSTEEEASLPKELHPLAQLSRAAAEARDVPKETLTMLAHKLGNLGGTEASHPTLMAGDAEEEEEGDELRTLLFAAAATAQNAALTSSIAEAEQEDVSSADTGMFAEAGLAAFGE